MSDKEEFAKQREDEIILQGNDKELQALSKRWMASAAKYRYSYHFDWLGQPIIQHPQDIVGMQNLLWSVKPDLIVETGIARGGSLIYYSSILELISLCGGNPDAKVIGVDIDIRAHNKEDILRHPMSKRITLLEGSSISTDIYKQVCQFAKKFEKILVCLDSHHTQDHVFKELKLYSKLVSKGSYCVVFDTIIEDYPEELSSERPWSTKNNPKGAVREFLSWLQQIEPKGEDGESLKFCIDEKIENTLLLTVAPSGFLMRK